jgi:hypothetical protein
VTDGHRDRQTIASFPKEKCAKNLAVRFSDWLIEIVKFNLKKKILIG